MKKHKYRKFTEDERTIIKDSNTLLSQQELANKLNIHVTTLSTMLNRERIIFQSKPRATRIFTEASHAKMNRQFAEDDGKVRIMTDVELRSYTKIA